MLVGAPKEIKVQEHRVGLTPGSVRELVHHGHAVIVESGAGAGIGHDDAAYRAAGASIAADADEVFAKAAMIVKVKEPQSQEIARLRPGQRTERQDRDQSPFRRTHLAPICPSSRNFRLDTAFTRWSSFANEDARCLSACPRRSRSRSTASG